MASMGPSFAGYSQGGQLPPEVWQQLSSMYSNPASLQALRDMNGGGSEYIDRGTGLTFAPRFKEINGSQIFDGGTVYNSQNPDQGLGHGAYSTAGSVYDANGGFAQPFQMNKTPTDFMDRFGFLIPLLAPFAASAMGAGAAGAGAAEAAGGAAAGTAAGAAGTAGAVDLGGGLMMTADGAIVGGAGAFAPATAAEMGGMGVSAGAAGGASGGFGSSLTKMFGGGGMTGSTPGWLGPATTLAGGLLGSKGTNNTATTSTALDPRLDSAVFGGGGLVPTAQGLMGQQVPVGQAAQAQLMQVGSGLLGQQAPNTPTNPYVAGVLDDLQRRNQQMLDTSFNGIRDNAVAAGGLGDTRQGVAQGVATARAADNFTGQAANFMGGLYNADQNRVLQQQTLGAGLLAQGQQAPWTPVNNAASVYGQFRPQTTTVNSSQGGGAMGAVGGALGAAQFGRNLGWWG